MNEIQIFDLTHMLYFDISNHENIYICKVITYVYYEYSRITIVITIIIQRIWSIFKTTYDTAITIKLLTC